MSWPPFLDGISADLAMDEDKLYKIALSMTPGVNAGVVRLMEENDISPEFFFSTDMSTLSEALGKHLRFENTSRQEALHRARRELEFIERHSVRVLYLLDSNYPRLLSEVYDAPVVLYKLGEANLDVSPVFSLVGTRRCTSYGSNFCKSLVSDLAVYYPDALVISGLAYGIDAAAHAAALENGLATAAVVAHGLDMIYPASHRDLARRIVKSGGAILSEYPSGVRPFQRNFLERNRIVAGLSELTIVAESEVKGGAMSTANQAFSYSREVVALPGRTTDITSSGCNMLISRNKAHIFTSVADLISLMQWKIPALGVSPPEQRPLFPELEGDMARVYSLMQSVRRPMQVDELLSNTALTMPALMSALADLEFEGIIVRLPGARYELA